MITIDVAVKHQFTFRDDGKLVSVAGPPLTTEGGWQRLLEESHDAPLAHKVIGAWPDPVEEPIR